MHPAKKVLEDYLGSAAAPRSGANSKAVAYDENQGPAKSSIAETMKGLFPSSPESEDEDKKKQVS